MCQPIEINIFNGLAPQPKCQKCAKSRSEAINEDSSHSTGCRGLHPAPPRPVAERLLWKGHYWEVSSSMMRDPAIWRIPSFTRMMRLRRIARRQTLGR